ncbi:MAG: Fe-S cluster assembly protein NifU, partial [Thermoplasmata archaeon]
IIDAKFQTFGCASAIASSSALTEMIKGLTVDEAARITNDNIAEYLGGLPKEKMHCSVMGRDALEKAIANYRGEPDKKIEGEIVCECFGVTDMDIRRAVVENTLKTVEDVTDFVKAGGGCGNCHEKIVEIINSVYVERKPEEKKAQAMTNIQKIRMIEDVLDNEIKPVLKKDGGNVELVDLEGNIVLVKLRGACANCQRSQVTVKNFIENKIRELVAPELVVMEEKSDENCIC